MARRRVAILLHEHQSEERLALYAISHLAEYWRADGIEVVHLFGVERFVPADLVLVHVDLSVVGDEYLDFARRYPVALNAGVNDIRKSSFSTLIVNGRDAYSGPVIVKSDLNYGGLPERVLDPAADHGPIGDPADYRVYESPAHVPARLRGDARVVVERFVPERDHEGFHTRMYEFLGDRHTSVRLTSDRPIVSTGSHQRWQSVELPPELPKLRRRLGLDYGKLDYVMHGSRPLLLDVNKTMGATADTSDERVQELRRTRAQGIHVYFG